MVLPAANVCRFTQFKREWKGVEKVQMILQLIIWNIVQKFEGIAFPFRVERELQILIFPCD